MKQFEFKPITLEEYTSFWQHHSCQSFLNSPQAIRLRELNKQSYELVGLKVDGQLVIATILVYLPMMKKFFYCYAQNGFLADYSDEEALSIFITSLKEHLKKKHCIYLVMDPYLSERERDIDGNLVPDGIDHTNIISVLEKNGFQHQGFPTDYSNMAVVNWMFVKELHDENEEELLKQLDQQTRWSIRKTIKQGVKVRELSRDELAIFLEMERETAKRRGFTMREESFYYNQWDAYQEHAKVLLAYLDTNEFLGHLEVEKEDLDKQLQDVLQRLEKTPNNTKQLNKKKAIEEAYEVNEKNRKHILQQQAQYGDILYLATSFFLEYEHEVVYLYSAANEDLREYNGPYAIQWYMLQEALKKHIPTYNFYGISGNFSKDAEDYGVYAFKKGFGGKVVLLLGDFILPLSPLYSIYRILKK